VIGNVVNAATGILHVVLNAIAAKNRRMSVMKSLMKRYPQLKCLSGVAIHKAVAIHRTLGTMATIMPSMVEIMVVVVVVVIRGMR
jgi:hypothetical protein